MERSIDRFYLHLLNYKDLIGSNCKEKNLEILLEKKPTIDLCKFFYKEIGKDFFWRDRLKRSEERRVGKECSQQCRSRWSPYH